METVLKELNSALDHLNGAIAECYEQYALRDLLCARDEIWRTIELYEGAKDVENL